LAIISWPFERGLPDVGMGAGATALAIDEDLHDALAVAGWAPTLERIAASDPGEGEVTRIFDLVRAQAGAVRAAVGRGAFPLVLAGGCVSAAGTVAGCGARGAVWLDAHADLDTPEDNLSGSIDVMALSILTGRAWQAAAAAIPGHVALAPEDVVLLYARDLAPYQRDALAASGVRTDAAALSTLPARTYLHVDLDALDTSVGHANRYAAPHGPSLEDVLTIVDATFAQTTVVAAALTAYEPRYDRTSAVRAAALAIAARIARHALTQRGTAPARAPAAPPPQ
jgi:arginase